MTLESEVRVALKQRAAQIPSSTRLTQIDYHPRRLRPRVAIGGGLATAAGTLAAVLSLTGGASSAFAGWSAQPTTPAPGQLAAAQAYCAKNVPTPGLPLQLTDTRGPFTFMVYSGGNWNNFCTIGPAFRNASGWSTETPVHVHPGNLVLWAEHTSAHADQAYGFLIARAADDVSAAGLTLEDGTEVTATVQNGWAVAWWPGSHRITSAQLTTPSGTETQTFPLGSCDQPADKCGGGGPHGGAPGGGPGGG